MSTTLTIRNLEESVKQKLRMQAASHGRSMEAEVREILTRAMTGGSAATTDNVQTAATVAALPEAYDMVKLAFVPGRQSDCRRCLHVISRCGTAALHGPGQNLSRLCFHGAPVAGRLHAEFLFHGLFQIANGQGGAHDAILINASNAVNASRTTHKFGHGYSALIPAAFTT